MAISRNLNLTKTLIEAELNKFADYVAEPFLKSAINYALFPGKRLRAKLLLRCITNYNQDICEQALAAAAAIEVTHAFSLVHDDMPALDNADTRRGMHSFFKKFGEDNALLVGDLLQYLAQMHLKNYPELLALLITRAKDMVIGQLLETNRPAKNFKELENIQKLKTVSLFLLCGEIAASILKLPAAESQKLLASCYAFGQNLQWHDDIADILEDSPGTNALQFISQAELEAKILANDAIIDNSILQFN